MERAELEKKQLAQKRAADEARADAEWKTVDQLEENLNNKMMDTDNKWRVVLGNNLYRDIPQNMGVSSQVISNIGLNTSESQITADEAKGIKHLLFKDGKGHLHDSWMQGFFFDENIKYGIKQVQGGPCGILATVQAFFLKHLLYGAKMSLPYLSQRNMSNQVHICLILALADILINASNEGETTVTLVIPNGQVTRKQPIQPQQCQKITVTTQNKQDVLVLTHSLLKQYASCFVEPDSQGVVLLVYSIILTRGIENIRGDMDLASCTLINEHGYAS